MTYQEEIEVAPVVAPTMPENLRSRTMSMSAAYEDRKAERKSKLESREERICFIVSPMDVLEFSEI